MGEMLPIVADTNFNRIGIIDDYISFIWTRRYYEPGDFELCVSVDSYHWNLLKKDYYIMRDDAVDVGIIERIVLSKDSDGEEVMIASGRFLSSILARRIIANQIQVSGTVENCVKSLINANAINPSIPNRKIPNLKFGTFTNAAINMEQQFTGDNLLEAISEICQNNGCGMRIVLTDDNKFSFYLYDGVNRSYDQSENPYVIFSNEFDNLESSEYVESYEDIATDILVAGEGEGTERKMIWASKQRNSGLARYEMFQDARNASTNNGAISDAVYFAQLREEGLEKITNILQEFAGEVNWSNYGIGSGVDIGDICVIENSVWGIGMNARIIEIIESVNEAGVYAAIPTFAPAIEIEDAEDLNAYVLHESSLVLMSESNDALLQEGTSFDPVGSEYSSAKRISELDEAVSADNGDYLALATNNATKKLAYGTLKNDLLDYDKLGNKPSIENVVLQGNKTFSALGLNSLTNSEIDGMLM